VVSTSTRDDADVDYLFLQVWPDRPEVSDSQNCGNMLAAVGPFAIEHGLVAAVDGVTPVRIWMQNTDTLATARVETPGAAVRYDGDPDGVPARTPPSLEFADTAGSSCGALLPTGNVVDEIAGSASRASTTGCFVCLAPADLGTGERPAEIEGCPRSRPHRQVRLAASRS
jgi:4-oxalomesaconate tautomerase